MDVDGLDYLRYFAALLFVLGLLAAAAWAGKRFGYLSGSPFGSRSKDSRRLEILESRGIDAKRRLVLIRRDGLEHLLLLSASGDLVVESNIQPEKETPAGQGGSQ